MHIHFRKGEFLRLLDETKRKLIMKVARRYFKVYGYAKTSMTKIASEAGLAVGTLYLYFPSKAELLRCTVEDFIKEHESHAGKVLLSKKSSSFKLKNYLKNRFKAVSEVRGSKGTDSELNQKLFELFPSRRHEESSMMINTVTQILKDGVMGNEFSAILKLEREVFVFMHSIAWFFLPTKEFYEQDPSFKDLEKIIDWFLEKWTK